MNTILNETVLPSGQILQIVRGDITAETTDAIVNAANASLQHGAGVAGEIVRKGGPDIQRESNDWVWENGPVQHGEPAWTSAGKLPCRYVIHAVGPKWGDGEEDTKLTMAISGALKAAEDLALSSIALPAISTGIFGFPKQHAAAVILAAIHAYFELKPDSGINLVRIILFDGETVKAFQKEWGKENPQ